MADISKKELASKKARKAQKEMLAYMQENDLDPNKDWTTHKKHGKKIQAWIDIINLGNKKSKEINQEKAEERKAKKLKKPEVHPKTKKVDSAPNVYDYPLIDGRQMPPELKKKYRQKVRTLIKTKSKEEAEKEAKAFAEAIFRGPSAKKVSVKSEPKKDKKAKKEEPKAIKKKVKVKDKKKKAKEED